MSQIITSRELDNYMPQSLKLEQARAAVEMVNQWIETTTHRCWGETKQVTERYEFKNRIWLRFADVQSIDSVELGFPGQEQYPASEDTYYLSSAGSLNFYATVARSTGVAASSRRLDDYVGVTYTYGAEDIPGDLKSAALGIAAGFYLYAQNENKDVSATSVGSYSVTYRGSRDGSSGGKDSGQRYFDVVDSYRTRRV